MKHCRFWVRLPNGSTTHTVLITDLDAMIAEHGLGKVGKGAKGV